MTKSKIYEKIVFFVNPDGKGIASLTNDEKLANSSMYYCGDVLESFSHYLLLWRDDERLAIVDISTRKCLFVDYDESEDVIYKIWKRIVQKK